MKCLILLIYLFLAVLDLCCCTGFSLIVASRGYPLAVVCGASHCGSFSCFRALVLGHAGFHSCGAWAYLLHDMWDLPRSETESMSAALAGRFFTTEPSGEPLKCFTSLLLIYILMQVSFNTSMEEVRNK